MFVITANIMKRPVYVEFLDELRNCHLMRELIIFYALGD